MLRSTSPTGSTFDLRLPRADGLPAAVAQALAMPLSGVDLVFSDVLMPGSMDRIALAEELVRRGPGMPVLLTSGYAGTPGRVERAGFTLLRKPHTAEQLRRALDAALRRGRPG